MYIIHGAHQYVYGREVVILFSQKGSKSEFISSAGQLYSSQTKQATTATEFFTLTMYPSEDLQWLLLRVSILHLRQVGL